VHVLTSKDKTKGVVSPGIISTFTVMICQIARPEIYTTLMLKLEPLLYAINLGSGGVPTGTCHTLRDEAGMVPHSARRSECVPREH